MKSVQIRRFFWSVFSRIRTEYGEILCIQSEYGKIRIRKNAVFGHFSRNVKASIYFEIFEKTQVARIKHNET